MFNSIIPAARAAAPVIKTGAAIVGQTLAYGYMACCTVAVASVAADYAIAGIKPVYRVAKGVTNICRFSCYQHQLWKAACNGGLK
jgi:hypothetical protein